ncbi:hypothetical protein V8F20_007210 [Naviculisporaceae sp. PSN 640]
MGLNDIEAPTGWLQWLATIDGVLGLPEKVWLYIFVLFWLIGWICWRYGWQKKEKPKKGIKNDDLEAAIPLNYLTPLEPWRILGNNLRGRHPDAPRPAAPRPAAPLPAAPRPAAPLPAAPLLAAPLPAALTDEDLENLGEYFKG